MNVHAIKLVLPVAGWATQGRYAVVEACVEAGIEVPAHVGHREDVVLHVLEGVIEVVADRDDRAALLAVGGVRAVRAA